MSRKRVAHVNIWTWATSKVTFTFSLVEMISLKLNDYEIFSHQLEVQKREEKLRPFNSEPNSSFVTSTTPLSFSQKVRTWNVITWRRAKRWWRWWGWASKICLIWNPPLLVQWRWDIWLWNVTREGRENWKGFPWFSASVWRCRVSLKWSKVAWEICSNKLEGLKGDEKVRFSQFQTIVLGKLMNKYFPFAFTASKNCCCPLPSFNLEISFRQ